MAISPVSQLLALVPPDQLAQVVLPQIIDSIEIRTGYSPPIVLSMQELLEPGPPSPTTTFLRPTIILRGRFGERIWAPVGETSEDAWQIPAILAGAGIAFSLFTLIKLAFVVGKKKR